MFSVPQPKHFLANLPSPPPPSEADSSKVPAVTSTARGVWLHGRKAPECGHDSLVTGIADAAHTAIGGGHGRFPTGVSHAQQLPPERHSEIRAAAQPY